MEVVKFGLRLYKKHLPLAFLALILGFIYLGIGLTFPLLSQVIIDYVIIPTDPTVIESGKLAVIDNIFKFLTTGDYGAPGTMTLMINIAKIFVLLMLIKHIFAYVRNNMYYYYGFKFEADLRDITFKKLLSQSERILSNYNTGDMLNILNSDITNFRNLFILVIPSMLDYIFYMTTSIIILFKINAYLGILPFAILPLQIFIFLKYIKQVKKINKDIRNAAAELSQNVQENINGIRIVKSFAAEDFEKKKFKIRNSNFKNKYFNQVNFSTKYTFIFSSIRHFLYIACIALGTLLAMSGDISVGAFTAFVAYVFNILDAPQALINYTYEIQHFMVCGERIYTFAQTGDLVRNPENPKSLTETPNIKINNADLIIDEQTILKNINLDLPYGKTLGIMGETGSGKTSFLKLLTRFYDTTTGEIYLGGQDIKDIDIEEVRRQFGFVFQNVFLFSNTIDSNIAFYNPDASQEEIVQCAKLACADGFIQKMQDGYNTIIGEKGLGLSGGQKQRISVARALLKNAPILLLDDVTSALDIQTEKQLLTNISEVYKDKTVIISAHRATSVKNCDEIIYLSHGEIAERGTHDKLMDLKGLYYEVYTKQTTSA